MPFPGTQGGWKCKHTDTFQDILVKMEIRTLLSPGDCGNGEAFDIADELESEMAETVCVFWPCQRRIPPGGKV
jgi:hypothetical protein